MQNTTELDAVNYMLRAIGERPVTTIDPSKVTKASLALETLNDSSRDMQERGWSFNSESEYTLTPDASTKEIRLPPNTLRVDPSDRSADYVNRGERLYDRVNHTYEFDDVVKVEIVFGLDWPELPESARKYIKVRAARKFQKEYIGAPDQVALTQEDEDRAFRDFLDSEDSADSPNILTTIQGIRRVKYQRP